MSLPYNSDFSVANGIKDGMAPHVICNLYSLILIIEYREVVEYRNTHLWIKIEVVEFLS
jgi:hypothetical protein